MSHTKSCWRCVLGAVSYVWIWTVHTMAAMGLIVFIALGHSPFDDAILLDERIILIANAIVMIPLGLLYTLWRFTGPCEKPKP